MKKPPTLRPLLLSLLVCASLGACRSAFVEVTVTNSSPGTLHLIEVDYPSASFGRQSLAAHALYHYRFKIQGSGPVTLTYTDDAGKSHSSTGPVLAEGQQGNLRITIDPTGNTQWTNELSSIK